MSEIAKTLTYLGSALVISAVAFFTRPGPMGVAPPPEKGKPLFAEFTDPYKATSMRIVRFDETLGEISTFQVAQKAGRWVIPTHEDYPADAEDQLKDAATSLVDLTVIGVASDTAGEHALFGVVEPNPGETTIGEKGVGTLITMKDNRGEDLAGLIIGKQVKDSEDQRYVRVPGRDRIYTVKIDPEKFSTQFEDWIEKDLLDLYAMDIKQIVLKDYSVDTARTLDGRMAVTNYEQRSDISVTWNVSDFKWELDELKEFRDGQLQPVELQPDEELNKETLDGLKDAVDELEIVDVERKPEGLGADLKADKGFLNDNEGALSLIERGFYPVPINNQIELLCSDGEILVRTKEGVEYVLRFGGIEGVTTGTEDIDDAGKLKRYVFVSARVDESNFPYPELEPLPKQPGEPNQPPTLNEADKPEETSTGETSQDNEAEAADTAASAEKADTPADKSNGDAATTDENKDEVDGAEDAEGASDDDAGDELADETERIVKENERKINEYKENRKKAEDKVEELNFRFADWYYVISDDVFSKIHLGRDDVVKKKEEEADGDEESFDIESFRNLEKEGLKGAETE